MDLQIADKMVRNLMAENGLGRWVFAWSRSRTVLGDCKYPKGGEPGRIRLSRHYAGANGEEDVRDTALHEIAHALTPGDDHGPLWREACVRLGCDPERRKHDFARPPGPWRTVCGLCRRTLYRYRKPAHRYYHCTRCGPAGGLLSFHRVSS